MSFKQKRKYNEDGHWEEPAIDADSGEAVQEPADAAEKADRLETAKIRRNLRVLESVRGLSFGTGRDLNYHVKLYRELLAAGWSHMAIAEEFYDLCETDHWKAEIKKGVYPGMNTLQFVLRNKKPR